MNLSNATDYQLLNILKYDNSIPNGLLKIVVNEAINRNLLQGYVKHAINTYFSDLNMIYRKYNVSYDDLMQLAYIAIWGATGTFKAGKAGFINCFLLPVQRVLTQFIRDNNSQKRKGKAISIQTPLYEELTIEDALPTKINIEKYVLTKLDLEERLSKLDERSKKIVLMYADGYTLPEIGRIIGISKSYSNNLYRQSLEIMRGA